MQVIVPRDSYEAYAADNHWKEYILMEAGKEFELKRDDSKGIYTLYEAILQNGVPGAQYGKVKIIGLPIENDDFKYLNTSLPNLMELDMSEADVYEIPDGAFQNKVLLNSVILPGSLTRIGSHAFSGCVSLENELNLPEGLEYIGDNAYYNCVSIPSLNLNDNLSNVGNYAFYNCRSIKGDFVAPQYMENIFEGAFAECSNITGIDLSKAENMTTLGRSAFENCSKATYVILPDQMTDINYAAFSGCKSVESVTFPTYIENIGGRAFNNNSSLRVVNLKGTQLHTIGENAFSYCTSLLAANLQETNLNEIGYQAFENCVSMKTVNLPQSYCNLHTLGTLAFAYCRSLENIASPGISPAQCYGADQTSSPFLGVSANKTTITIPDNDYAYEAYLMANFWGAFISKDTHQEIINESLNGSGKGHVHFSHGESYDGAAARAPRRAAATRSDNGVDTDVMAELTDTTRLYVPTGNTISFVITPEKGYKIGTVLFGGEDVTSLVANNVFTTSAINAGGTMQVSFVEAEHIPATSIKLNKSAMSLPIGGTEQLTATLAPAEATDNDVIWKSSNTKIATVDAQGTVTATGEGSATITATAEGGKLSALCAVTVTKDNYLAIAEEVETEIESTVDLEVSLVNKNDIYGFQCDIYLPDGITLDKEAITYSQELTALPLMYGTSNDGKALRIMRYSDSGNPIAANGEERAAFTLPLTIGNIAGGNMQVKVANIKFASENDGIKKYIAPDITTNLVVYGYAMGDVNQDEAIDVTDIVAIGYRTVNKPITTTFNERLADLNYDGDIDISDLALEVRLVLSGAGRASGSKKNRAQNAECTEQSADCLCLNQAGSSIAFSLNTTAEYTAYQCDMAIPEGYGFAKDSRGNAIVTLDESLRATHRVISNEADGVLKMAVFSDHNALIPNGISTLITVALCKNGNNQNGGIVTVSNTLFAKPAGDTIMRVAGGNATMFFDGATGIDTVEAGKDQEEIYDIQGRRVSKADKGVYIINKKKVVK